MNWNPFKKVKVFPVTTNEARMPSRDIFVLVERPAEAVQEQSGWDALSDYQKAARLEYRALQGLRYGRIEEYPSSIIHRYENGVLMSDHTVIPEQAVSW